MMVVLYFFCEWLPILVIYNQHRIDFRGASDKRANSLVSEDTLNLMPDSHFVPVDYRRSTAAIRTLDETIDHD